MLWGRWLTKEIKGGIPVCIDAQAVNGKAWSDVRFPKAFGFWLTLLLCRPLFEMSLLRDNYLFPFVHSYTMVSKLKGLNNNCRFVRFE
jgi:hypothetical protein